MKTKEIISYLNDETFCIAIPKYYENEKEPSWKIAFTGSKDECKKVFSNYPDFLTATMEENHENRQNKIKEYLFLLSINHAKQAEKIKSQYNL